LRIGRLLGVPVYLHFSWLILFGLLAWTLATGYFPALDPHLPRLSHWIEGLVASLLLLASILLHELGHAVAARRSGLEIQSVTLFVFGGVAEMAQDPADGRTEFRIALAGPLVSLGLAIAFGLASVAPALGPAPRAVARYLALINVSVALFNLVPAFPLDGGRLLRGLLWNTMGKARATRAAATAGGVFALFLIASGVVALLGGAGIVGLWYFALGFFLREAAGGAYGQARLDEALRGVTVRDVMLTHVETLPADISLAEAAQTHFLRTGYGSYPVVRGESVVGLLCLRDVLRVPPPQREGLSVQGAMRCLGPAIAVAPDEALGAVLAKMARTDAPRQLVIEDGRLVGLLTMSSVLRQLRVREELAA
jgi:Zn-dependent protease/predicted transcriptional regulator